MRRPDGIPIRSRRTWIIRVEVLSVKQFPTSARSIEFDVHDSLELSKIFTTEAILFAMAPFCSRSDNSMEEEERHSVLWDHENGEGTFGSGSVFFHDLTRRGSSRTFRSFCSSADVESMLIESQFAHQLPQVFPRQVP